MMAWDDFVDSLKFKLALENDKKKAQAIANAATHAYAADLGLTGDQMRSYAQMAASYNAAKGGMYAQDIEGRARMGAAQLAADTGKFTPIFDPVANRGGILNTKLGGVNWFSDEVASPGKSAFDKKEYNPSQISAGIDRRLLNLPDADMSKYSAVMGEDIPQSSLGGVWNWLRKFRNRSSEINYEDLPLTPR